MNTLTFGDFKEKALHRIRVGARLLDPIRKTDTFAKKSASGTVQRIYVINLDRKPNRWKRLHRELNRFRTRDGERLSTIARRFSAIDARHVELPADTAQIIASYSLSEQLTVHPNPVLAVDAETKAVEIEMTRQEVAVALSHIAVWRLIASGDVPSALVLEDDVIFGPGFVRGLSKTWSSLSNGDEADAFDLLYLDYKDVGPSEPMKAGFARRRAVPGLWEAAGYILTKGGAQKLLERLPIHGPVDLWLNLQFEALQVYSSARPLIEQRTGEASTNSYSILPVLSMVGAITRDKQTLPAGKRLPGPVIAVGSQNSGLTALAIALSMIGYTCASDMDSFPVEDLESLRAGHGRYRFNAFVNVGRLAEADIRQILRRNPRVLLIQTDEFPAINDLPPKRALHLPEKTNDKWALLADFLSIDYPSFDYPTTCDRTQRRVLDVAKRSVFRARQLHADRSPWIQRPARDWRGLRFHGEAHADEHVSSWRIGQQFDTAMWRARSDTFPSNLALFREDHVRLTASGPAALMLTDDSSRVRDYASGAIASRESYLYGRFSATLQPPRTTGTITGLFLHRNGPRQEIDIEILGRNTTKMLTNVYFNPGPPGTKLEYGYRGTPIEIDLGFDAADAPHEYEILWAPSFIEWRVDGITVHRRNEWGPTPIPDQPLELNLNLWISRSIEFGGSLDRSQLPATLQIHTLDVASVHPAEERTSHNRCTDAGLEPNFQR